MAPTTISSSAVTDAEVAAATGHASGVGGDPDTVYRALRRGAGREQVNDDNVAELIALAHSRGDAQLEYLLREWRSPCGDDPKAADLAPQVQGNLPPP